MRISYLVICELAIRELVNSKLVIRELITRELVKLKFVNYCNRINLNKLLFGFLGINIVTLSLCYIVTYFQYRFYENVC